MKIILVGANGKMGQNMQNYLLEMNENFVGIDKQNLQQLKNESGDVVLDFSSSDALTQNLDFAVNSNLPIVIATTGHSKQNLKKIKDASKIIPIFMSSNFSTLFNIMNRMLKNLKGCVGQDYVIEEVHHKTKIDSPSGSAKQLISTLNNQHIEPQIVCLRLKKVVGEHKVTIMDDYESLTLHHNAISRKVFCVGAYNACKFLLDKKCGLYNMEDLIDCM